MRRETETRGIKNAKTHVYTGDGKGKTTAALGLGLRAAGRGFRVIMIQFLKDTPTGELAGVFPVANFEILRFQKGRKGFYFNMNESQKKELAQETAQAFEYAETLMKNQACDLLILDEVFGCITCGLIKESQLISLIENKTAELVLTGRNAPEAICRAADYVSAISCVKHPMEQGALAREGVEF